MKIFLVPFAVSLALWPQLALAHAGAHEAGFVAGMGHPLGGADHVLAMVAVGLWAALTGGVALWAMPLAFVTAMLSGGVLGSLGAPLPGVEPMILASILVLGAAVALALRLPIVVALAVITVFGLAHGFAHGAEGPDSGLPAYAAGFVLATAGLHTAGLSMGLALRRQLVSLRGLGVLTAGSGAALIFG
jgi:urease accessory protein